MCILVAGIRSVTVGVLLSRKDETLRTSTLMRKSVVRRTRSVKGLQARRCFVSFSQVFGWMGWFHDHPGPQTPECCCPIPLNANPYGASSEWTCATQALKRVQDDRHPADVAVRVPSCPTPKTFWNPNSPKTAQPSKHLSPGPKEPSQSSLDSAQARPRRPRASERPELFASGDLWQFGQSRL